MEAVMRKAIEKKETIVYETPNGFVQKERSGFTGLLCPQKKKAKEIPATACHGCGMGPNWELLDVL